MTETKTIPQTPLFDRAGSIRGYRLNKMAMALGRPVIATGYSGSEMLIGIVRVIIILHIAPRFQVLTLFFQTLQTYRKTVFHLIIGNFNTKTMILVTGATGHLGGNAIDFLLNQ